MNSGRGSRQIFTRLILTLFLSTFAILGITGCSKVDDSVNNDSYSISGIITNPPGTSAVQDVLCTLYTGEDSVLSEPLKTTSDAGGRYLFSGVSNGKFRIAFSKDGYINCSHIVSVNSDLKCDVLMFFSQDWSKYMDSEHPYDPTLHYVGAHVIPGLGVRQDSNAYRQGVTVYMARKATEQESAQRTDADFFLDKGYLMNSGLIDWDANHTSDRGITYFYGVGGSRQDTEQFEIWAQKNGYNISKIDDAGSLPGEIVYYTLDLSQAQDSPPAIPPMSQYSFLYEDYYPDGTLKNDSVIFDFSLPNTSIGGQAVNILTHRLTSDPKISLDGKSYSVYAMVPEYMTVKKAYELSKINGGKKSTFNVSDGSYSTQKLYLAKNEDRHKYYLPNLYSENVNATDKHDGLTQYVIWPVDPYAAISDERIAKFDSNHKAMNGWGFIQGNLIQAIVWKTLGPDGGTDLAIDVVLQQSVKDHLETVCSAAYLTSDAISTMTEHLTKHPYPQFGTGVTINPIEAWLKKGAFLGYVAFPGFQRNYLRRYTAWGTWNLLNNTSGLFVRKDGGAEISAILDSKGNPIKPVPLVVQTWEDQSFVIINKSGKAISGCATMYPGDENYYQQNVYLDSYAGLVPSTKFYAVYDNNGNAEDREIDGWLGLKDDRLEYPLAWNNYYDGISNDGGNRTNNEPGGQARKPYMLGAFEFHNGDSIYKKFRFQHSNSFLAVRTDEGWLKDKMYKATYYADWGQGYKAICSISYKWMAWDASTGSDPKWQDPGSKDSRGVWVPQAEWLIKSGDVDDSYGPNFSKGNLALAGGISFNLKCVQANALKSDNTFGAWPDFWPIGGNAETRDVPDNKLKEGILTFIISGAAPSDSGLKHLIVLE